MRRARDVNIGALRAVIYTRGVTGLIETGPRGGTVGMRAGTHPGAFTTGGSGKIAAREMARTLRHD